MSEQPRHCPMDGLPLRTPAHEFLHNKIHSLAPDAYVYGQLSMLPYFLYDRVAEVMIDYAEQAQKEAREKTCRQTPSSQKESEQGAT